MQQGALTKLADCQLASLRQRENLLIGPTCKACTKGQSLLEKNGQKAATGNARRSLDLPVSKLSFLRHPGETGIQTILSLDNFLTEH